MLLAGHRWGNVGEFFEAPAGVAGVDEIGDGTVERFDAALGAAVNNLFVEDAVEALGHVVDPRFGDEGEARVSPQ